VGGSIALLVALAYPAFHPQEIDSLPFSNYPMFAHDRSPVTRFDVAVLIGADGVEHRLDPRAIGRTDQPVQAVETVRQAIRTGQTDALCAEIAMQVDAPGTIQVISVHYDAVAWFRGERRPVERVVHANCPSEAA
jgi:hypothetical protein